MMRGVMRLVASIGMAWGLAAAVPAAAQEQVVNGDFETGTLSGWTTGNQGGSFCCDNRFASGTGVATSGTYSNTLNAIGGTYSAFGDFDGDPQNIWLRQLLQSTGPVSSATLSFSFSVMGGYNGAPRVFSAGLLDSGGSSLATLYSYDVPLDAYYWGPVTNVSLDITSAYNGLAAGDYYLDFNRYVPSGYQGPGMFALDNVSLMTVPAPFALPEPATWAMMIVGLGLVGGMLRRRGAPIAVAA